MQIAVETFKRMRQQYNVRPDTVSYGNILKCTANLVPPGRVRVEMALQLFESCCREGLVGDLAWNEVRRAVPANELQDRLGLSRSVGDLRLQDLPRDWRCNVRDKLLSTAEAEKKSQRQQRRKQRKEDEVSERRRAPVKRLRNISEPSYQSGRDM